MRSLNRHYFCDNCWKPIPYDCHVWSVQNGVDLCQKCYFKIAGKMIPYVTTEQNMNGDMGFVGGIPKRYSTKGFGFWLNHGSVEDYDEKVRKPLK